MVLWQLYIAVAVEQKLFEVATMIQEDTQTFGGKDVPAGPALRDADGKEHVKSATEGKGEESGCWHPQRGEWLLAVGCPLRAAHLLKQGWTACSSIRTWRCIRTSRDKWR